MITPRGRLLAWIPALALALFAGTSACSDDDVLGPNGVQGTYELVSVNDEPLPAVLEEEEGNEVTFTFQVTQGSLTLTPSGEAGGTYTVSLTIEILVNGEVWQESTQDESGTYTVSGNAITFLDEAGEVHGTVDGNQITVTFPGSEFGPIVLVFAR